MKNIGVFFGVHYSVLCCAVKMNIAGYVVRGIFLRNLTLVDW